MMFRIYTWLESFTLSKDNNKLDNFIYNLFIPFFLFLEYLCFRHYWKKVVLAEILTSDAVVEFLDKQEFGYNGSIIYKADLLTSNEFFDRLSLEESRLVIKKEYVETLSKLFTDNIPINIEEYVNLLINTEIKIIHKNNEIYREKIYTVVIQFCRQYYFDMAKRKSKNWGIILSLIIIVFFIIKFYLHHLI